MSAGDPSSPRGYAEVVTHTRSRDVDLPRGGGRLVLLTLDNEQDHRRPNTLGPTSLAELRAAVDAALSRPDVVALAVTGKPYVFCAGADLGGVAMLRSSDEARMIAELGHAVFARLRTASVPTFAFINGLAMGGGLELTLHCAYRTISTTAAAVALPETYLGLVPGWGGTTLVPRLVGADRAVQLIIENPLDNNRTLTGPKAYELGLADAIFEPADFLEQSISWVADVVTERLEIAREEADRGESWTRAVERGRLVADARRHGAAPAPLRALELIDNGRRLSLDDALAAEIDVLVELIMSDEFRAGVYAFDLVQRRARRPAGAPDHSLARPVTKVGVIGAGLMASQLALLFARRLLVPVMITDLDQERVDRGLAHVHEEIDKLRQRGRVSTDLANRLTGLVTGTVDLGDFAETDLIIEAVYEDLAVKREVFTSLEKIVSPSCVLATNTSALSLSAMASGLEHPERVVGMHFFNPVAVMPLLEVVRGAQTDDATLATAFAVGSELRKSSILVRDAPAFVVNRLLTRFLGTVLDSVQRGVPIEDAERALLGLGLPMGPFELLGLVGPAVALHVAETMHAAYPERFAVSPLLRQLAEQATAGLVSIGVTGGSDAAGELAADDNSVTGLRDRALQALADEIRIMLDEGVVADVRDIDLAMLLGAGWPFHLGGITPHLDRTGISERVNGRAFLPPGVASVS